MARVVPTPFLNYTVEIRELQQWPMLPDKKRKFIEFATKVLRKVINGLGRGKKPYYDQCEAARAKLAEMLSAIGSDQKNQVSLSASLTIEGSFGNPPDINNVNIEYRIF